MSWIGLMFWLTSMVPMYWPLPSLMAKYQLHNQFSQNLLSLLPIVDSLAHIIHSLIFYYYTKDCQPIKIVCAASADIFLVLACKGLIYFAPQ